MILLALSILLILSGIAVMLFPPIPMMRYIAAILCLVGVYLLYYYWKQLYYSLRKSKRNIEDEATRNYADLNRKLQKVKKERDDLEAKITKMKSAPSLPSDISLEMRVARLREHFSEEITNKEYAHYRRTFAELTEAAHIMSNMKAIGEHTTTYLQKKANDTSIPLDEPARSELEYQLMRLALATYDISTGYHTPDSTQSLAVALAAGDETSLQKAAIANDNVYETPKVIRVLKCITEKYNKEKFIVNDYKI